MTAVTAEARIAQEEIEEEMIAARTALEETEEEMIVARTALVIVVMIGKTLIAPSLVVSG